MTDSLHEVYRISVQNKLKRARREYNQCFDAYNSLIDKNTEYAEALNALAGHMDGVCKIWGDASLAIKNSEKEIGEA